MDWYTAVLRKYAVFSGRARRKEYWMFALVNIVISIILSALQFATRDENGFSVFAIVSGLYSLAILLPSLGVGVRRLHDTGRSGWWWFIVLVPFIGAIVLLVFMIQDGQPGTNQYGPNPKTEPQPGFAA
jgi:uncharacterized membrane protein YhaH (DUF805 family)